MKVLVFTDKKIQLPKYGHTVDLVLWGDQDRIRKLNIIDYDGVIFDLESVESQELGDDIVRFQDVFNPSVVLNILKEHNSFVVVVGNPAIIFDRTPFYDFLGFKLSVTDKGGDNLKAVDPKSLFYEYLSSIKKYTYFFEVGVKPTDEMMGLMRRIHHRTYVAIAHPTLETRSGHLVSSVIGFYRRNDDNQYETPKSIFQGSLRLLPSGGSGVRQSIINILDIYLGNTPMGEPEWASEVLVVGQDALDEKIAEEQVRIDKHQLSRDGYIEQRAELRRSLEVLYRADKPLEASIKWYLERVGITVAEPEVDNGAEFYFEFDDKKFVAEVKSTTKETIDKKGLRQVTEWQDEILIETGDEYKPVLIVSNQYDIAPSGRTDNFLPDNLVKFAEKKGVAVLSVAYIYQELQKIEAGTLKVGDFVDKIYQLNGVVNADDSKAKMPKT